MTLNTIRKVCDKYNIEYSITECDCYIKALEFDIPDDVWNDTIHYTVFLRDNCFNSDINIFRDCRDNRTWPKSAAWTTLITQSKLIHEIADYYNSVKLSECNCASFDFDENGLAYVRD